MSDEARDAAVEAVAQALAGFTNSATTPLEMARAAVSAYEEHMARAFLDAVSDGGVAAAARVLLELKDGPRDEAYEAAKPRAWEQLRHVLRLHDEAARASGTPARAYSCPLCGGDHAWCDPQDPCPDVADLFCRCDNPERRWYTGRDGRTHCEQCDGRMRHVPTPDEAEQRRRENERVERLAQAEHAIACSCPWRYGPTKHREAWRRHARMCIAKWPEADVDEIQAFLAAPGPDPRTPRTPEAKP
jgi:hypothetical protein